MLNFRSHIKRSLFGAAVCAALSVSAGMAQAATPFEVDVSTAIDRGINYLATIGAFNGGAGDATGLTMEALLEKRASGIATDPPQGYVGANATDQGRLRSAATYILNNNTGGFAAYRDGQRMFALSGYALTGGPDKSTLATTQSLKQAMDALVDRALAAQRKSTNGYPNAINQGYWCYTNAGCEDSSTTQFVVAGLAAAKTFYSSNKSGDAPFADAGRVALINTALALTKQAYELNALTGSDNGNCAVLTGTERGHGYNAKNYNPSLQQTASGIYIQLFGGADVNSPMVQNYLEWLRNRYRWQDLDSLGNFWSGSSYWYYLWSSFKGMELIRQSGVVPAAGKLGPDSLGKLPAASAPSCVVRQEHKDPASFVRPASFGAGAAGYYSAEPKSQYFDYAHQILRHQCPQGGGNAGYFGCNTDGTPVPGDWNTFSHQAYALLVLQRSTGGGCVDTDGDGVCDSVDNCPAVANPGQENTYGDARGDACEPRVVATCDIDGNGAIDNRDISAISALRNKPASVNPKADPDGNGIINVNDARACVLRCTKPNCAQ